jgi:hypothetical protein
MNGRAIESVAGALGTPFFIYATQLFAHVPAAIFLFSGFLCIRSGYRDPSPSSGQFTAVGFLLALALITDYIVLLAVPVLTAYALHARPGRWQRILALAAGALPPLLLWMIYNHSCFGSPFSVGFHHLVDARWGPAYRSGLLGIQSPDGSALLGMTVLPQRGIVYLAPVLLLAPVGWVRQLGPRKSRAETLAALGVVVAVMLFATTTVDWRGGWAVGARYLVPTLPFLLLGVAGAIRVGSADAPLAIAFRTLAPLGVVMIGLAAASFPNYPEVYDNPTWQLAFPLVQHARLTPNLLLASGWLGNLLPFALLSACAVGLLLFRSWPAQGRRQLPGRIVALATAAALLLAMQQTASPADRPAQRRVTQQVLTMMGYPSTPPWIGMPDTVEGPPPHAALSSP